MQASATSQIFGPERAHAQGVQVPLPRALNLISPEGSCEVFINTGGRVDRVSWWELWVGMRAVSAICVERGEGGISTGHGRDGGVFVILKSGSQ